MAMFILDAMQIVSRSSVSLGCSFRTNVPTRQRCRCTAGFL